MVAIQPLVVQAAIDLLPPDIRAQIGLTAKPMRLAAAKAVLKAMAAAARYAPNPVADVAWARMGLTRAQRRPDLLRPAPGGARQ